MKFPLFHQHGMSLLLCQSAKKLLGEITEFDPLGFCLPEQSTGVW